MKYSKNKKLIYLSLLFFVLVAWSYLVDDMIGVVFWGILLLQNQIEELEEKFTSSPRSE